MIKRTFDLLVASIGLTIASIPMLVSALLVRMTSKGPILYSQPRIGRHGRPFSFYKFRTMRVARPGEGGQVTAQGDPRVTPVGRILRRWKLDELPQLLNVLRGDMSIVGPRPEVERFVSLYSPEQRKVLDTTPGLASMAQLVYPHEAEMLVDHTNPDWYYAQQILPRKLAVDLEYEARRTLWSDLGLILEIGLLVLGRRPRQDTSLRLEPPARHM